ncbi:MAG: regulatory protein RecX [Lachnospiraceae bacterium]|nr:regulatory protein RecX [Lachnospiraceae bacterium]
MYITEILPFGGRQSKKMRIRLDDGSYISLYKSEVRRYGLTEGMDVDDGLWDRLMQEVFIPRARFRAMHLLEKQDRTRSGLLKKLSESGYPRLAVEAAVEYVEGYHYIDDDRYARSYVRYHQSGRSRRRIMTDLRQRGVSDEVIQEALEAEYTASEEDMIRQTLMKRHFDPVTADIRDRQRIYRFLLGRGFRYEDIDRALQKG